VYPGGPRYDAVVLTGDREFERVADSGLVIVDWLSRR
jgi:hypothetical protein